MRYITILLLICFITNFHFGQSSRVDWEESYEYLEDLNIQEIIQTYDGNLVAVGEINAPNEKRNGIFLLIDIESGKIILKKDYGGLKNDGFKDVTQLPDGSFLLAGYIESGTGKKKKDAYLLNIDNEGTIISSFVDGSSHNDEFKEIEVTANGEIYVAGLYSHEKNGNIWILQYDNDSNTAVKNKMLGNDEFKDIRGMEITTEGEIICIGTTQKHNRYKEGDGWIVKLDKDLKEDWRKVVGGSDWDEVFDLDISNDENIIIAGMSRSNSDRKGDKDMWLIKLTPEGRIDWQKKYYGGSDDDAAYSIATLREGGYAIFGETLSHHPQARRTKTLLIKTDAGGKEYWNEPRGGNKDDKGTHILELYDGSLVLVSTEEVKSNEFITSILKTKSNHQAENIHIDPNTVSIGKLYFVDKLLDGIEPENRYFLSVNVVNHSPITLNDLNCKISSNASTVGINFSDQYLFDPIESGETVNLSLPFSTDESLQSGIVTLQASFFNGDQELGISEIEIQKNVYTPPKIDIEKKEFKVSERKKEANTYTTEFLLTITNLGDQKAEDISIEFSVPTGVKVLSTNKLDISSLDTEENHTASFTFIVNKTANYDENKIPVSYTVQVGNTNQLETGLYLLDVENPIQPSISNTTDLIWVRPTQMKIEDGISCRNKDCQQYAIEILARSNQEFDKKDFKVYVNDILQESEGSRLDEAKLTKAKSGDRISSQYSDIIQLDTGINKIYIEVQEGLAKSSVLEITYTPEKPILHVLAIGAYHSNLQYTGKDAVDFSNLFIEQNELFKRTEVTVLSGKESTEKGDIELAITDLKLKYGNDELTENDVLVLFISSHGKKANKSFNILASDYKEKYADTNSGQINYESDIINALIDVPCKKLVFIDACNSGAAITGTKSEEEALAEALHTIINTNQGVTTIASCKPNERSYEDKKWENGIFTKAILKAFKNEAYYLEQTKETITPDSDRNRILTIGELMTYIQKIVPLIVEKDKPNMKTAQNPTITNHDLGDNFPIYYFGNP